MMHDLRCPTYAIDTHSSDIATLLPRLGVPADRVLDQLVVEVCRVEVVVQADTL